MRGAGSALFAGIVLMVVGVLNIVYGIAAVSDSKFYVEDTHFVFTTLHTWGWIAIVLGAIGALLNIGGPHPWWNIGIFAVCVWVIYSLTVLGEPEPV